MSHYINLLEEQECLRVTSVEVGPLFKIGGAALGVAILGLVYSHFAGLQREIRQAEDLQVKWKQIEKPAEEAVARSETLKVLKRDLETLEGWSTSRFTWPELLEHIAAQIPEPLEKTQFTLVKFDELIDGLLLRDGAASKPVTRQVSVHVRGLIQSERPEIPLTQFQQNLLKTPEGVSPLRAARLQGDMRRIDAEGALPNLTEFNFILELQPRTVRP